MNHNLNLTYALHNIYIIYIYIYMIYDIYLYIYVYHELIHFINLP